MSGAPASFYLVRYCNNEIKIKLVNFSVLQRQHKIREFETYIAVTDFICGRIIPFDAYGIVGQRSAIICR